MVLIKDVTALIISTAAGEGGGYDLSRVDLAFFTFNGWVGVGLFAGLVLDLSR